MKSLLFAVPLTIRNRTAGGSRGRALVYAALGALPCLVVPLTAAYAQDPSPGYTGTVSCVETVAQEDSSWVSIKQDYEVAMISGMIVDRWGPGNDVKYEMSPSLQRPGKTISPDNLPTTLTMIFWAMPANITSCTELKEDAELPYDGGDFYYYDFCLPFEHRYSETGSLNFEVRKEQMVISGTSVATMEHRFGEAPYTLKTATCTWKLSGPFTGY